MSQVARLSALVLVLTGVASAQIRTGFDPFTVKGPGSRLDAVDPTLRKWYVPQELYHEFGWEQWRSSNYARQTYERYVDVSLEGSHYYDVYGNYIFRGWKMYDWSQQQPSSFGSTIYKDPRYRSWFNNLVVSSAHSGQYYMALTIGDRLRTTLTPLTFSKPTFNGVQLDVASDKYSFTALASRASDPGLALTDEDNPPRPATDFANLIGMRGTAQVGDFVQLGATYANTFMGKSVDDWADNSMKGRLTTGQNGTRVRTITIRLRDDSPEDGEGGALLFSEAIHIDGRRADIAPSVKGGVVRAGRREASGSEEVFLVYDLESWSYVEDDKVRDVNWFKEVSFELVLANDYLIDISSNSQVDLNGQLIFLPVARADGNVRDATNQRVVRFDYGLPTANEIVGLSLDVTDVLGFWVRGEWALNRRHERFPNPNQEIVEHSLATKRSQAYYLQAQRLTYPWFAYGEVFSIDDQYNTRAYIPDKSGRVVYDRPELYWFEMVDDNDDQDRLPDWDRNTNNQTAGNEVDQAQSRLGGIYPGLDENNDFVSDFNQNDNFQPDYEEPFLRYGADPPEYLFGVDMNNNMVIDRFENDTEADYPYRRDHRGYNAYVGAEVARGAKVTLGHLREQLISSDRKSRSTYALVTVERDYPGLGVLRVSEYFRSVKDNIQENLEQWQQLPNTKGAIIPFEDPLAARDTWINTLYSDFTYRRFQGATISGRLKHERYNQRHDLPGYRQRADFLGLIAKADTELPLVGMVLAPKIKSSYRYGTPVQRAAEKEKSLSETVTLLATYKFAPETWIQWGLEYTAYFNLRNASLVRASTTQVDDFQALVIAAELTNVVDYLGYRLSGKVGFRQETRYFKNLTRTGNVVFVQVFAGLGT
ncbi:hypothetical protein ACFL6X_05935 [Candidatus Latescibacterota bacterium]